MLRFLMRLFLGKPKRRTKSPSQQTSAHAHPPRAPSQPATLKTVTPRSDAPLKGSCFVIDGDTIQIGQTRLRVAGIDAPELDHPWGQQAKWALIKLCKGQTITAVLEPELSYDRIVATCYLPDGRDISAEMVKLGMAIDWPKFSGGKYAQFEPEGIRKRHWKAAARQRGDMRTFNKTLTKAEPQPAQPSSS